MNDTFVVLADGTYTFCCSDYEGNLNLGILFLSGSFEAVRSGEHNQESQRKRWKKAVFLR
jgi:uncharacterized protein with FMN-binding domain